MVRPGARVSLILALVFPAIVCAAVALAYYGYRYAEKSSSRTKTSLMENNQQLAQRVTNRVQDRIDRSTPTCSRRWSGTIARPSAPSFDLPAGRRVGRRAGRRAAHPLDGARARSGAATAGARSLGQLREGPRVEVAAAVDAQPPGNFRHLHQLFEGKSVLIAYASKKTEDGHDYYVAAKLDLGLIAKDWIPDEIDDISVGHRRVVDPRRGRAADLRRAAAGDAVPVRIVVRQDAVRVAHPDHAERRRRAAQAGGHRAAAGPAAGAGVAGDLRGRAGGAVAVGARRAARRRSSRASSSPTCRTS